MQRSSVRLARAARPEHADDLAALDVEVDAAQDLELAEALADLAQGEHRPAVRGWAGPCHLGAHTVTPPPSPSAGSAGTVAVTAVGATAADLRCSRAIS